MQKDTTQPRFLVERDFTSRLVTPEQLPEKLPLGDRLDAQFDQGIARLLLQRANTFPERAAAVKSAMLLGMTLHEIEECLDERLS